MILKNILKISQIFIINLLIFLIIIIISDLYLGSWFKNDFKYKISSERNINKVYKLDFEYLSGSSHYVRNDYGFRVNSSDFKPNNVDVVFVGGSTINQKFINFRESIVGIISNKNKNLNFANSGIDGMSIKGHINSFKFWFDKIEEFKPKYFIYILGINDRYLVDNFSFRDHIDNLEESSFKANIREYLESNSFFYKQGRYIKSLLFLKYNLDIGTKKVKRNHVYLDRDRFEFITYEERESKFNLLSADEKDKYYKFQNWYLKKLEELTKIVQNRNAVPIFITQTTGYGHSNESLIVAKTIMKNCKNKNLLCINLAKNLSLKYEDFYDESHLNISGSKKFAEYINKNLEIF